MFAFIIGCLFVSALFIYIWLLVTSSGSVHAKLMGMPIAFFHLLFSRDNHWKKPTDPKETWKLSLQSGEAVKRKRVYFIRHGESLWNQVFNRGLNVGIIWRFFACVLEEWRLLALPDSVFWDSPLSPLGIRQAVQMAAWLEAESVSNVHACVLRGDLDGIGSVLCSSNLRRSVSTVLTGLSGRLHRNSEELVHVVSSAQEITRNIDGYALSPAGGVPSASFAEASLADLDKSYSHLSGSFNRGNKPLFGSNGLKRMQEFAQWVFTSAASEHKSTVILGGHSLWFREFFKSFLPGDHISKTCKMVNCGIVAFDLVAVSSGQFVIDPESVQIVYGGFEEKKSSKNFASKQA